MARYRHSVSVHRVDSAAGCVTRSLLMDCSPTLLLNALMSSESGYEFVTRDSSTAYLSTSAINNNTAVLGLAGVSSSFKFSDDVCDNWLV